MIRWHLKLRDTQDKYNKKDKHKHKIKKQFGVFIYRENVQGVEYRWKPNLKLVFDHFSSEKEKADGNKGENFTPSHS